MGAGLAGGPAVITIADLLTNFTAVRLAAFQQGERNRTAEQLADAAEEEVRRVYLDWLAEAAPQLEAEEDGREREALLLALLLLLAGRIERVLDGYVLRLGNLLDAGAGELDAVRRQVGETVRILREQTLPRLMRQFEEARLLWQTMEDAPAVADAMSGKAAQLSLAGGIVWTAYNAALVARAGAVLEARWQGPITGACPRCAEQMQFGWRPKDDVPLPGPAVCYGLTSCRHSLSFRNPVTGRESMIPEEIA